MVYLKWFYLEATTSRYISRKLLNEKVGMLRDWYGYIKESNLSLAIWNQGKSRLTKKTDLADHMQTLGTFSCVAAQSGKWSINYTTSQKPLNMPWEWYIISRQWVEKEMYTYVPYRRPFHGGHSDIGVLHLILIALWWSGSVHPDH